MTAVVQSSAENGDLGLRLTERRRMGQHGLRRSTDMGRHGYYRREIRKVFGQLTVTSIVISFGPDPPPSLPSRFPLTLTLAVALRLRRSVRANIFRQHLPVKMRQS